MQELLCADTRNLPDLLLDDRSDYAEGGPSTIGIERYISPDYHAREAERLWGRVWQIACHEDQIQKVGDYVVYETAGKSFIVVRTAKDKIKAFHNACLHRGRTLCEASGHAQHFRCKFHGFLWRLDGRLGYVPSRWDFPGLEDGEYRLAEVKVGTWSRFVFMNLDPEAEPLEDYLGSLPDHFRTWNLENRHLVGHVAQIVRANWKVCVDAFLEFFHGQVTHPQAVLSMNDVATRYVTSRDHPTFSYMVLPCGVASPSVAGNLSEAKILASLFDLFDNDRTRVRPELPDGQTARKFYAEIKRAEMAARTGRDFSEVSDSEMIDGWMYSIFPNFTLWGAHSSPLWYRFRPWQNRHDMALMEVFIMPEFEADIPPPPTPPMTLLGPDQRFSDAPELGVNGEFFNQDLGNLEWVQKGMESLSKQQILFARYQESENRQFHAMVDAYVDGDGPPR